MPDRVPNIFSSQRYNLCEAFVMDVQIAEGMLRSKTEHYLYAPSILSALPVALCTENP